MLHRLDAAFLRVGEARGGLMVKFHGEDSESLGRLRDEFERSGLEVRRLEEEGRLYFRTEASPPSDRAEPLRRFLGQEASAVGRTVWATFDWAERLEPGAALAHQEALAALVEERRLVVRTAVLEDVMDQWPPELRRRAQTLHSGIVWLSEAGLTLSRVTPPPPD